MRKVEVVPTKIAWSKLFEQEKEVLQSIFTDELLEIHHIGSTAIKNIHAKPIIDIMLVVAQVDRVDVHNRAMEQAGYECLGENGILNRRFFTKGGHKRTHHVHIFQEGNMEIKRHLAFRDYMNAHPKDAQEYGKLKVTLADQFPYNIQAYSNGKNEFISKIDKKATAWISQREKSTFVGVNKLYHRQAIKAEYTKLVDIWARAVKETHEFLRNEDFKQIKKELPSYFPHVDVQVWLAQEKIIGFSGVDGNKV